MKIKVPKVKVSAKSQSQWVICRDHFNAYMDLCEKEEIGHDMFLQSTADCLAHLLVRHTNNTQAIISVMGATIARHEDLKRTAEKQGRVKGKEI